MQPSVKNHISNITLDMLSKFEIEISCWQEKTQD
jgi:hypothetical protein